MSKKTIIILFVLSLLFSCKSKQVTISVYTAVQCQNNNGYWYKDKCWADFEDNGIAEKDIDSVVQSELKEVKKVKVIVNNKTFKLETLFPEFDDGEVFLTASFNGMNDNIVIVTKLKNLDKANVFTANAMYLKGNLFTEEAEPQIIGTGEVTVNSNNNFDLKAKGVLSDESNNRFNIDLFANEAIIGAGNSKLEIKNNEAYLSGTLGTITYKQIKDLIIKHPEVKTIVLTKVEGSVNDAVNMHTGRIIREAGLTTKVTKDSNIASGGVDLFTAGVKRIIEKGAKIGVHSWSAEDYTADSLSQDHPAHQYQLAYFEQMLGRDLGSKFYFYTLIAAPADEIHYMSQSEIEKWNIGILK